MAQEPNRLHQDEQESLLMWQEEAQSVIEDVRDHVSNIEIASDDTERHSSRIFFNLTTKEGAPFCVELSDRGFRIVGLSHDAKDLVDNDYFETPYSLLDQISPMYRSSMVGELVQKLNRLGESENK